MHLTTATPDRALGDDPTRTADHGYFHREAAVPPVQLNDADILSVLCDLFAGRADKAFGEDLDWWAETFQCDISPKAAAGVVVKAISKWPFDQRAGAAGVKELENDLVQRARQLLERSSSLAEGAI